MHVSIEIRYQAMLQWQNKQVDFTYTDADMASMLETMTDASVKRQDMKISQTAFGACTR
jgi:hypothetical protein